MEDTPIDLYMIYIVRGYKQIIKNQIKEEPIKPPEMLILIGVYYNEGATQSQISSSYRVTEAYITKTLNKLKKNNLIKKEYSTQNKTKKLIYLTNKGKKLVKEVIDATNKWENYITSDLDSNEKEIFNKCLEKISKKSMNINRE